MESTVDDKEIECSSEMKEGRFSKTFSKCVDTLFKMKGSLAGRDIIISISPAERKKKKIMLGSYNKILKLSFTLRL